MGARATNLLRTLVVVGVLGCCGLVAEDAVAQRADQNIGSKQGVGDSFTTKEFDEERLPGYLEVGLAGGSIFALVAAYKWL